MRPLLVAALGISVCGAHDLITTRLTWSREISRIFQRRCMSCHREGGAAPMALTTYAEVRPWAKAIRDEVLQRRMPQWGAIKGYGEFAGDISLSQDEINRIAEWVEGGAPEGGTEYLPSSKLASDSPQPPRAPGVRTHRFTGGNLTGIKPLTDVEEAKVTAHLPDGSIQPLLWLRGYQREWNRTFVFASPLNLPRGTRIVSDPPVALEFAVKSPRQGR